MSFGSTGQEVCYRCDAVGCIGCEHNLLFKSFPESGPNPIRKEVDDNIPWSGITGDELQDEEAAALTAGYLGLPDEE